MSQLFELRMELTSTEAEQFHLALFVTDSYGQWQLLDDWTADNGKEAGLCLEEAAASVDIWLQFGGRLLPA